MTPADLEAAALAAGASPAAAAAARAFVEALPEGTPQPKFDRYNTGYSVWLDWGRDEFAVGIREGDIPHATVGIVSPETFDWRPGQPVPPRVLELIVRVAT